jgi:putative transposase
MLLSGRTSLTDGARVFTEKGAALVVSIEPAGVHLRDSTGHVDFVDFLNLSTVRGISDGEVAAVAEPVQPLWDALDDGAKRVALRRLEIVQEILTGYMDGQPKLAREGEPHAPFGPGFGVSESRRCMAMAELLAYEDRFDRELQRRVRDGEISSAITSSETIRRWVRAWKRGGLVALIDGRSITEQFAVERVSCNLSSLESVDAAD